MSAGDKSGPRSEKIQQAMKSFRDAVLSMDATWEQKGVISGYNMGRLRCNFADLEAIAKMRLGGALALADAAGLPLLQGARAADGATPRAQPSRGWERVDWYQEDKRKQFVELYASAKVILTCHERLDSWIMPEEMFSWWVRTNLVETGYNDQEMNRIADSNEKHRHRSLLAREHSDYRIRILAAIGTFRRAALEKAGRDWLREVSRTAGDWHRDVSLTVALEKRWDQANKTIAKRLGLRGWHKLTVIDDRVAAYWPSPGIYFYTHESDEVLKFRAALQEALGEDDTPSATEKLLRDITAGKQ